MKIIPIANHEVIIRMTEDEAADIRATIMPVADDFTARKEPYSIMTRNANRFWNLLHDYQNDPSKGHAR